MDFKLDFYGGCADMTWEAADSIANNVWLSLNIRKGDFFAAPLFGNRFYLLRKNTELALEMAEHLAKEALQWLLDTNRATSIEITAERDPENQPNRLLLRGFVVQADERTVPFEQFIEVI